MLKDYPVLFNEEEIIRPSSWSESYGVIESVNETEAGTDQVVVVRYDKLSVSASFKCSSTWAGKFKRYSVQGRVHVSMYDLAREDYRQRIMRIRNFKASPVEGSHLTSGTNGLWEVSFDLEEF